MSKSTSIFVKKKKNIFINGSKDFLFQKIFQLVENKLDKLKYLFRAVTLQLG